LIILFYGEFLTHSADVLPRSLGSLRTGVVLLRTEQHSPAVLPAIVRREDSQLCHSPKTRTFLAVPRINEAWNWPRPLRKPASRGIGRTKSWPIVNHSFPRNVLLRAPCSLLLTTCASEIVRSLLLLRYAARMPMNHVDSSLQYMHRALSFRYPFLLSQAPLHHVLRRSCDCQQSSFLGNSGLQTTHAPNAAQEASWGRARTRSGQTICAWWTTLSPRSKKLPRLLQCSRVHTYPAASTFSLNRTRNATKQAI
jgi:hypothetical protein